MNTPIILTEEQWMNSPLSIARHYGRIRIGNNTFVIVNKEGKDLFQLSAESAKQGREKAIQAGEPADLIDERYLELYQQAGRERFIQMVEQGLTLKQMRKLLNH